MTAVGVIEDRKLISTAGFVLAVSADIPATELDNMIYTVFNMSGKVLKQGRYDAISHTVRLPETIQSGIYMINFSSPNVNKVIKLIVE